MEYLKELEAIQIWIKATAGLNSVRLKEAKAKLARPVILWEAPGRAKDRSLSQYVYITKVRQYGRLFASSLEEALLVQEKLSIDIEELGSVLAIRDDTGVVIGHLKAVKLEWTESSNLDVPFSVQYEIAYGKNKPADAPQATFVTTKVNIPYVPKVHDLGETGLGVVASMEAPPPIEYTENVDAASQGTDVDQVYPYAGATIARTK